MRDYRKWTYFGGFLLIFLIVYSFRKELYNQFIENYNTVSLYIINWLPKIIILILVLILTNILITFTNGLLKKYLKYVGKEKEYNSLKSIVKYVIWFIALIAIFSIVINNLGVWLTSLGLMGFGITFALQKPILNLVGWITIMFNRTYTIGDRIKVADVRGDVKEIQMMYTVMDGLLLNTDELSGKLITIPNEMVLTSSITNFTKNSNYLWEELSIGITYESNWEKAEKILKDVAFRVVNKYVGRSKDVGSNKSQGFLDTIKELKQHLSNATHKHDKTIIEDKIEQVNKEYNQANTMENHVAKDRKKEPIVRVELDSSSVDLNVRYVAHYKYLRVMKSEINTGFLNASKKEKDIEIAYPHLQIINKGKK